MSDEAERTEEVVARVMRATRDEKIKLDATVAAQTKEIDHLRQDIHDLSEKHSKEHAALSHDRDYYLQHATRLETELRSVTAILNSALSIEFVHPQLATQPADDGEPTPYFLHHRKARSDD